MAPKDCLLVKSVVNNFFGEQNLTKEKALPDPKNF